MSQGRDASEFESRVQYWEFTVVVYKGGVVVGISLRLFMSDISVSVQGEWSSHGY